MLQRVLPPPSSAVVQTLPLFDSAATRRLEHAAQAQLPPHTLMQRAGLATAQLARAIAPHAQQVWVVAGPGNNGGDGLEAAYQLHQAGTAVRVSLCGDPQQLPPDAQRSWQRAHGAGVHIAPFDAASAPGNSFSPSLGTPLGPADLAIDALLGLGSQRAPSGVIEQAVHALNALPCAVLSLDLPTGLNPDTGCPWGKASARATHTLSLLTLKPGLFTAAGRDHVGEVWWDDLGVNNAYEPASACIQPAPQPPQRRQHAQHKGSFGDVLIVGGCTGMGGAALLAARASLAAGAGRVSVDLLDAGAPLLDSARPELMLRPGAWQHSTPAQLHASTVVAGCGGGEPIAAALPRLLAYTARLVLDADALNAIAADGSLQTLLSARNGRGASTVLTPHPLEAARLLACDTATVQSNRLGAAQTLAHRFQCVVVLKGSGSVIAAPGHAPCINITGNAALATAGTGDVLAGWLGGSWSAHGCTAMEAAQRSTWWHGHAADLTRHTPLRAADLIEAMHALTRR